MTAGIRRLLVPAVVVAVVAGVLVPMTGLAPTSAAPAAASETGEPDVVVTDEPSPSPEPSAPLPEEAPDPGETLPPVVPTPEPGESPEPSPTPDEDADADLEKAEELESTEQPQIEAEDPEPLAPFSARMGTFSLGDTTTPHAYFSLRQELAPGGVDDRGTVSAIIDTYVVNPTGPALTPQSGGHPTQSASVPLEGDRQADSMPATPGNGVTRYQYRVNQTGFNANSLGIAANGDAYFTAQFSEDRRSQASTCSLGFGFLCDLIGGWAWGSWSAWSQQSTSYTSIWRVNLEDGAVSQLMTRSTAYPTTFTGGAVNTAGVYHVSYVTNHTSPANSMRFYIYRLSGSSLSLASTATTVANSRPTADTAFSGDVAFDGYDNLHVLVGGTGTSSVMARLTAAQVPSSGSANPTGIAVTSVAQTAPAPGAQLAGIAFPFGGYTVWQGASTHSLRSMAALGTVTSTQTYGGFPDQRDLASIVRAPQFQLTLNVVGGLQKPTDRFTLSATPGTSAVTRNTPSGATSYSLADDWITVSRALASGNLVTTPLPFSVTAMAGTGTDMADYAQQWSCVETTSGAASGTGAAAAGTVAVGVLGNPRMECTVTLTPSAPNLIVSKSAHVGGTPLARDAVVAAGTVIQYQLTFDNSTGTAAATGIDYTDYLADVLDDATVTTPVAVSPAGGITAASVGENYQITGSVPAGQTRTVTFSVTVKANETDAVARAAGSGAGATPVVAGYRLNNYLLPTADPAPTADCAAPAPGAQPLCTTNRVRAWSVRKDSQPEDGAMIHSGGNIYYRVKVTNFSGETVTGVQVADDMTQTLAATTWDPGAPPAVDVPYGVSFYTADGVLLPGSIVWDPLTGPAPVFSGDDTFDPLFPDGLPFPGGTWTFQTPSFTIPAEISGQRVAYAIVGYAVEGGFVADPDDPGVAYVDEGSPVKALPNAVWVNTVQAGAASVGGHSLFPNRCSANANGGTGIPPGDIGAYYDCKVWHSLGESYFHIWKKSTDPVGQNLLGSTFVLADTEADARAGVSSRWLCRTNNDPNLGAGYRPPGSDPTLSGAPDWGAISATYNAIAAWNLTHPGDQREQCGRFFYLSATSEGQQAGSWRAMDIRGGDTVAGGSDPLPNWRTASAYNNGVDDSAGRHGTYWLAEVVSPSDHQLLAQPMQLWVAPSSPTPDGLGLQPGMPAWYDYQGRLSLPVTGLGETAQPGQGMGAVPPAVGDLRRQCVSPWVLPAYSQPACVMPTGWTMPVFDPKLRALPLTGGPGIALLTTGGAVVLAAALAGAWWWRRRRSPDDPPGGEGL